MILLFCGSGWLPIVEHIASRLEPKDTIHRWDRARPLAEVVAEVAPEVILPSNARVDAAVIAAATRLRLIQQPAAGTENIDVAAAAARGIPVCNAPGANRTAVAEATILLLLLRARRWPLARAAFAAGTIGEPLGCELAGRRLVVVGTGRTGSAVAERARALGMHVTAIDSQTSRAALVAHLATADAVTLHCPLTAATRGFVDDEALSALPAHALVVNVSRGAVIDRDALLRALGRGHLGRPRRVLGRAVGPEPPAVRRPARRDATSRRWLDHRGIRAHRRGRRRQPGGVETKRAAGASHRLTP